MYLCIAAIPKVFSIQGKEVKPYAKAANVAEEQASARKSGRYTKLRASQERRRHTSPATPPFLTAACVSALGHLHSSRTS